MGISILCPEFPEALLEEATNVLTKGRNVISKGHDLQAIL